MTGFYQIERGVGQRAFLKRSTIRKSVGYDLHRKAIGKVVELGGEIESMLK